MQKSSFLAHLFLLPIFCALSGCHAKNSSAKAKAIICENDLQPVLKNGENIPEKYRPLINAFGQLGKDCTVTHLGKGIGITAGHCFYAPPNRTDNYDCKAWWPIRWGVRVDSCEYLVSHCVTVLAYQRNQDRDYAIFKMDNVPPVSVEVDLSTRPKQGQKVTIFGFPRARPLEWSKVCSIEPASNGKRGADMFSHQCDTEPGSSGSVVIDDLTLKVVGIHNGGEGSWNYGTFIMGTPVAEFLRKSE